MHGYRKLDIDLLKNFIGYSNILSDDEKRELWNDPTKQVYYDKMTVYFVDKTSMTKEFSQLVNNHHKLYDEFNNWVELKQVYGATSYNISPDTPIYNHEVFRIWDTSKEGSNIDYITLHVAPQGQNEAYDVLFAGAKEYNPEYEWLDTTSTLMILAHRINEIIHASDFIENVGDQFVVNLTILKDKCEQAARDAEQSSQSAEDSATRAEEALRKQQELKVKATPVDVSQDPSVVYDSQTNTMNFGLPRSDVAVIGLSHFAIDTANGHLSFQITNEADVKRVYVDEVTGNVIIELNK